MSCFVFFWEIEWARVVGMNKRSEMSKRVMKNNCPNLGDISFFPAALWAWDVVTIARANFQVHWIVNTWRFPRQELWEDDEAMCHSPGSSTPLFMCILETFIRAVIIRLNQSICGSLTIAASIYWFVLDSNFLEDCIRQACLSRSIKRSTLILRWWNSRSLRRSSKQVTIRLQKNHQRNKTPVSSCSCPCFMIRFGRSLRPSFKLVFNIPN